MHNLHLITIQAETPQEACANVESEIEAFGNENNWHAICGCVSEDNEVYIADDGYGRYPPTENMTIADVEKMVKNWTQNFSTDVRELLVKFHLNQESLNVIDWYQLGQYCFFKSEQVQFQSQPFDLWTSEFHGWELNQCGLTNLLEAGCQEKKYVVFVDIHS